MTIQHIVSLYVKKSIMCLGILLCSAWHMLNVDLNVWDVRPVACRSSSQQSGLSLLSHETEYLVHFIF